MIFLFSIFACWESIYKTKTITRPLDKFVILYQNAIKQFAILRKNAIKQFAILQKNAIKQFAILRILIKTKNEK
jgi:hypothetical protein